MLVLLLACDAAPTSTSVSTPATPAAELTSSQLPSACATAPKVTWENWGQGFFMTRCGACHSPSAQDRHGAPVGVDFVTHADLAVWSDAVYRRVVTEGTMPLGGGLDEEDLALLKTLLLCGS